MLLVQMGSATEIIGKLDEMEKQISELPDGMYRELEDWQTQDVKFRRPYTDKVDEHTVETVIWPRGRRRRKGRRRKLKRIAGPTTAKRRYIRHPRGRSGIQLKSSRPSLRDFLFDELVERMGKLLEDVSWQ